MAPSEEDFQAALDILWKKGYLRANGAIRGDTKYTLTAPGKMYALAQKEVKRVKK
jgi:hypothetical protein